MNKNQLTRMAYRSILALIGFGVAEYLFLYPAGWVLYEFTRPGLSEGETPRLTIHTHRKLSPRFERWARERVASGRAAELSTGDLVETEWPPFGSLFYLWATESLQRAWDEDPTISKVAPRVYASGAIDAAAALLVDPGHATWVKEHWGDNYEHVENVFYRMMLIGGLTAHYELTENPKYLDILRGQVESLSAEIDRSYTGLLNDYPHECYPPDVLVAVACIRRADNILGTDHGAFAARAIRAFEGDMLDEFGLVPFMAHAYRGEPMGWSRGSGNSYVSIFAPELWPEHAETWYEAYAEHFWKKGAFVTGFSEDPRQAEMPSWSLMDMDAGPVIAGHGTAASAFGVGAARANGRFDHAYPLTAEMIAMSWPLPDGTLLIPRYLSHTTDAPYLGEAGILFNLTREPAADVRIRTGGSIPFLAYGFLAFYLTMGLLMVHLSVRELRQIVPKRIDFARALV